MKTIKPGLFIATIILAVVYVVIVSSLITVISNYGFSGAAISCLIVGIALAGITLARRESGIALARLRRRNHYSFKRRRRDGKQAD